MMNNNLETLRKSIEKTDGFQTCSQALPLKKKWEVGKHTHLIQGTVCVLVSFFLLWIIVVKIKQLAFCFSDLVLLFCTLLVAIFCLTKGIYTLIFYFRKSELSQSVCQFLLSNAYNQLYFTYERMLWLWVLTPVLIIAFPVSAKHYIVVSNWFTSVYFLIVLAYGVLLLLFSKSLCHKKRYWKNEIDRLSKELQ